MNFVNKSQIDFFKNSYKNSYTHDLDIYFQIEMFNFKY